MSSDWYSRNLDSKILCIKCEVVINSGNLCKDCKLTCIRK